MNGELFHMHGIQFGMMKKLWKCIVMITAQQYEYT